jgi:hypothetical protein
MRTIQGEPGAQGFSLLNRNIPLLAVQLQRPDEHRAADRHSQRGGK